MSRIKTTRKYWTTQDLVVAYRLKESGWNSKDIAERIDRTPSAVETALWKLNFLVKGIEPTAQVVFTEPFKEAHALIATGVQPKEVEPKGAYSHQREDKTDATAEMAKFLDCVRTKMVGHAAKVVEQRHQRLIRRLKKAHDRIEELENENDNLRRVANAAKRSNTQNMLERALDKNQVHSVDEESVIL